MSLTEYYSWKIKDNYQGLINALISNPLLQLQHERVNCVNTSDGSHLQSVQWNNQGSHFLSTQLSVLTASTPSSAVSASHTMPASGAEASRLEGRVWLWPRVQSSSSDTKGLTLSCCRKVISGAQRFPRLLLTHWVAPRGRRRREPMIGDGAFEQHSFRRKTAVVVAQINGGRPLPSSHRASFLVVCCSHEDSNH